VNAEKLRPSVAGLTSPVDNFWGYRVTKACRKYILTSLNDNLLHNVTAVSMNKPVGIHLHTQPCETNKDDVTMWNVYIFHTLELNWRLKHKCDLVL